MSDVVAKLEEMHKGRQERLDCLHHLRDAMGEVPDGMQRLAGHATALDQFRHDYEEAKQAMPAELVWRFLFLKRMVVLMDKTRGDLVLDAAGLRTGRGVGMVEALPQFVQGTLDAYNEARLLGGQS